jgi:hypothetical protein
VIAVARAPDQRALGRQASSRRSTPKWRRHPKSGGATSAMSFHQ